MNQSKAPRSPENNEATSKRKKIEDILKNDNLIQITSKGNGEMPLHNDKMDERFKMLNELVDANPDIPKELLSIPLFHSPFKKAVDFYEAFI